jgi:hypothetical protein
MKNNLLGSKSLVLGAMAIAFGLGQANAAHASDRDGNRTVQVNDYANLFGLSYETNGSWTYQCGELLTRRVLEVLRSVPSAQRPYVLEQIRSIRVVDHVPAWPFGRERPQAEYNEDSQTLWIEFRRNELEGNPRAYCIDSAYHDVVRLVTAWKQEAAGQVAQRQSTERTGAASDAGQDQIRDLLNQLQGVQRAPAVQSGAGVSDAQTPRSDETAAPPVEAKPPAPVPPAGSAE